MSVRQSRHRLAFIISIAVLISFCHDHQAIGQGAGAFGGGFGGGGFLGGPPAPDEIKRPFTAEQLNSGKDLFFKTWKEADVMAGGDGLGPVFNARSCVECHGKIRPGGAGNNDHNVDVLAVTAPLMKDRERAGFIKRMARIEPALTDRSVSVRPSVTLHKFGTDPEYADWRLGVFDMVTHRQPERGLERSVKQLISQGKKRNAVLTTDIRTSDLRQLSIVQRSTPALFGAGLIAQIPDEALKKLADVQAARHDDIKGQVAIGTGGKAGKFGWRGQTSTLKEFVMGACANELGLEVPGHSQGLDPLDPKHRSKRVDLSEEQCNSLTAFVADLPRPRQRRAITQADRTTWDAGEQVFTSVGCANCHVRTVADVDGLYSDLLLHDLGPNLADPAGATPSSSSGGVSPAYYGGPADVFAEVPPITKRQWRTAPLWGVADSAPYLHDGRAETLNDAIRQHAGEATASVALYVMLPSTERQKLLAFLKSLAAPSEDGLVASK